MTAPEALPPEEAEVKEPGALVARPAKGGHAVILRPITTPAEMIARHKELGQLVNEALQDGTDYGKIPGTGKPTLLKPGAERLCIAFGLEARYTVETAEVDHDRPVEWRKSKKKWRNAHRGDKEFTWVEEVGASVGLYRYVVRCDLLHRGTGEIVGSGLGSCSSMESKYVDRPRDCENTVLKMGQKRALIAAVLNTLGLSDRFTQDVEDLGHAAAETAAAAEPEPLTHLETALRTPLIGQEGKWGGWGSRPLGSVPSAVLVKVSDWLEGRIKDKPDDRLSEALLRIKVVLDARSSGEVDEPVVDAGADRGAQT